MRYGDCGNGGREEPRGGDRYPPGEQRDENAGARQADRRQRLWCLRGDREGLRLGPPEPSAPPVHRYRHLGDLARFHLDDSGQAEPQSITNVGRVEQDPQRRVTTVGQRDVMAGPPAPTAGCGNQFSGELVVGSDVDPPRGAARDVRVYCRCHGQPERYDAGGGTRRSRRCRLNGSYRLLSWVYGHGSRFDDHPFRAGGGEVEFLDLGAEVLDHKGR